MILMYVVILDIILVMYSLLKFALRDPLKRLKNFRKCFAQLLCSFRWKELETFGEKKKFGSLIVL